MTEKFDVFNASKAQLDDYFLAMGESKFRSTQLIKWLHQKQQTDFSLMTNLSVALRERLGKEAIVYLPEIIHDSLSKDGTRKWLMKLSDGGSVETVFIPEDNRGTLCVSSQVGCALNCQFCATATQGFNRNLTMGEIIGQVWQTKRLLALSDGPGLTNVVMMGMGEPLLNFDNVVAAMELMMDDNAYGLSKYRVTLSTSGVVPAMARLKEVSEVALAVSLHAPDDALRTQLVPINKKYPIAELMAVCRDYFPAKSRRQITFEYVMLKDVNDHKQHAKALVKLLQGVSAKVNLIPFNPYPGARYQCSTEATINEFRAILSLAGIVTVCRKTRGEDIQAACGQLVGQFQDRTSRRRSFLREQGEVA